MSENQDLNKALDFERQKNEVLLDEVIALEDELVNRSLADFAGIISDETKPFWTEQLISNRAGALTALQELAAAKRLKNETSGKPQPLHNRAKVRQGSPAGDTAPANTPADTSAGSVAARIRNRAHELRKSEGISFSKAFRRAEQEIAEGDSK